MDRLESEYTRLHTFGKNERELRKQTVETPSAGAGGGHEGLVPRVQVRADGVEQQYWVSPKWFEDTKNTSTMSDADVNASHKGIQSSLEVQHQARMEAIKRGASPEEVQKLYDAESDTYWARRYLGREVKKRGLAVDAVPLRTQDRAKAVKAPKTTAIPEPKGPIQRIVEDIKFTDAETRRYTKERVVDSKERRNFYREFLDGRGLDIPQVEGTFFHGWGTFVDAPFVVNTAVGMTMGYPFEEVWKRLPEGTRLKNDEKTVRDAVETVRKMIPAIASYSRNYFRQQGMETVKLYRAVKAGTADSLARQINDPSVKTVDIGTKPVSAWTTDEKFAKRYAEGPIGVKEAGVVISLDVPVDRIVYASEACAAPGYGEAPEVLIASGFDEVLRVPRDSLTFVKRERGPLG